jgi:hypothetical protein
MCWGADDYLQVSGGPPDVAFDWVSAGGFHTCAVRSSDGQMACWGWDDEGQVSGVPPGVAFDTLSAGGYHTCGVYRSDGTARCWGRYVWNPR